MRLGKWVKVLMVVILIHGVPLVPSCDWLLGPVGAGEKEDLQKDYQLIQTTIERNPLQNELLRIKGQEVVKKLQEIEKAEAKVKEVKSKTEKGEVKK